MRENSASLEDEVEQTVRVAFVDESGSPSPADGSRFLAVSVLALESSRSIETVLSK